MINRSVITNIDSTVIWTLTATNDQTPNTGVYVDLTIPTEFQILSTATLKGSVAGNTWTIGDMSPNESVQLIVTLQLNDPVPNVSQTFSLEGEVFGLDTLLTNNKITDSVQYNYIIPTPAASGVDDVFGAVSVDVSANDTPCTQGESIWRLNESSIIGGTLVSWDEATGKGSFTYDNLTQEITFTYDLICVVDGQEFLIGCDVNVEIKPIITDLPVNTLGYLCTPTNQIVFVKEVGDTFSFTLYDGSDYTGDPNLLGPCCCGDSTPAPTPDNLGDHTAAQNLDMNDFEIVNVTIPEYPTRADALAALGPKRLFRYTDVTMDFRDGLDITSI